MLKDRMPLARACTLATNCERRPKRLKNAYANLLTARCMMSFSKSHLASLQNMAIFGGINDASLDVILAAPDVDLEVERSFYAQVTFRF